MSEERVETRVVQNCCLNALCRVLAKPSTRAERVRRRESLVESSPSMSRTKDCCRAESAPPPTSATSPSFRATENLLQQRRPCPRDEKKACLAALIAPTSNSLNAGHRHKALNAGIICKRRHDKFKSAPLKLPRRPQFLSTSRSRRPKTKPALPS